MSLAALDILAASSVRFALPLSACFGPPPRTSRENIMSIADKEFDAATDREHLANALYAKVQRAGKRAAKAVRAEKASPTNVSLSPIDIRPAP